MPLLGINPEVFMACEALGHTGSWLLL